MTAEGRAQPPPPRGAGAGGGARAAAQFASTRAEKRGCGWAAACGEERQKDRVRTNVRAKKRFTRVGALAKNGASAWAETDAGA